MVYTCAGVMPPGCPVEKVAEVREFAKTITPETLRA